MSARALGATFLLVLLAGASPLALRGEEPEAAAPRDPWGDPLPRGAVARLGTVRHRSRGAAIGIGCFALSSDGRLVATGDEAGRVRLAETETGKLLQSIDAHRPRPGRSWDGVQALALSPDGEAIASSGTDGTIALFEVATGKEVYRLHDDLYAEHDRLIFSPDGKTLCCPRAGRFVLRDAATGRECRALPARTTSVLGFSPDGRFLATAAERTTATLIDLERGGEARALDRFERWDAAHAFSPDGKLVAFRGDGATRVREIATGKLVFSLAGEQRSPFGELLFSRDSRSLVINGGRLRILDVESGKTTFEFVPPPEETFNFTGLAFSPDGKLLVARGRIFDLATARILHARPGYGLTFTPDGKRVVSRCYQRVSVFDLEKGVDPFEVHEGMVEAVAFSPDGKTIATAASGGRARLWDATGKLLGEIGPRLGEARGVTFSPRGETLAIVGDEVDLVRVKTGETASIPGARAAAFSPDGKRLVVTGLGRLLRVHDAASGAELESARSADAGEDQCAFSPDGKLILSGGRIFDATTLAFVRFLRDERASAFSPDSRLVAAKGRYAVHFHDVANGTEVGKTRCHEEFLTCVAVSPDGKLVAAGAEDAAILLWDRETMREVARFLGHEGAVRSLAFSPDGKTLASASVDTTALLWKVPEGRAPR